MIHKFRNPMYRRNILRLYRAHNISIRGFGRAKIIHKKRTIRIECLGETQCDGVAWLHAIRLYGKSAYHILPHIHHPLVSSLINSFRPHHLLTCDIGVGLWHKLASRGIHQLRFLPRGVVIVGLHPFPELVILIVSFTVELVGGADGTAVGDTPAFVADDALPAAVLVGDFELQNHARRPEVHNVGQTAPLFLLFVVAHGHVASACEGDADGVPLTRAQEACHVECVEIDPFTIIGKRGLEPIVIPNRPSVDTNAILP